MIISHLGQYYVNVGAIPGILTQIMGSRLNEFVRSCVSMNKERVISNENNILQT